MKEIINLLNLIKKIKLKYTVTQTIKTIISYKPNSNSHPNKILFNRPTDNYAKLTVTNQIIISFNSNKQRHSQTSNIITIQTITVKTRINSFLTVRLLNLYKSYN